MHPKMIWLSLRPFMMVSVFWALLFFFIWEPALQSIRFFITNSCLTAWMADVMSAAGWDEIRAVMAPRGISRCSTSTAVRPPKVFLTLLTVRIGSTFLQPGAAWPTCRPVVFCGVGLLDKGQLPLVSEDALWSVDHKQHQTDSNQHEAQGRGLLRRNRKDSRNCQLGKNVC